MILIIIGAILGIISIILWVTLGYEISENNSNDGIGLIIAIFSTVFTFVWLYLGIASVNIGYAEDINNIDNNAIVQVVSSQEVNNNRVWVTIKMMKDGTFRVYDLDVAPPAGFYQMRYNPSNRQKHLYPYSIDTQVDKIETASPG